MNRLLAKILAGFAIIFMVLELTYINSESLNYLSGGLSVVDGVFAIVGSIAFSTVTVLIMMLSKRKWLKIVFPLFDMALVFCGFNLAYADDLMGNPIRFYLSIFLAVFTGLITYSLGQLNADQYVNDSSANQIESKRIIEDQKRVIDELTASQNESKQLIDDLKSKLAESKRLTSELLPNHILWSNFINKKKSESNRNGHEAAIEKLAERVKAGEKITIEQFTKELNAN